MTELNKPPPVVSDSQPDTTDTPPGRPPTKPASVQRSKSGGTAEQDNYRASDDKLIDKEPRKGRSAPTLSPSDFAERANRVASEIRQSAAEYASLYQAGHQRGVHGQGGGSGIGSPTESALLSGKAVRDALNDASTALTIVDSKAGVIRQALSTAWAVLDAEIPRTLSDDVLTERSTELREQLEIYEAKVRRLTVAVQKADRARELAQIARERSESGGARHKGWRRR